MSGPSQSFVIPSVITTALIAITVVLPLLSTAIVGLRFYARSISKKGIGAEDWTIFSALILLWAMSVNVWVAGSILGVDVYKGVDPIEAAELSIRTTWIDGFMLGVNLALTKISILLFYKGIFVTRWFRISVWFMIIVISGWALSTVFTQLFMASPITDAWNVTVNHYTINYDDFYLAVAGMSLVFDVITLLFPLPVISRLQMPTSRKMYIAGIFSLGGFCCIAAAVRFYYLYGEIFLETAGDGDSQFAAITDGFLWAKVECSFSIIAACLPTLGPLVGDRRNFFSGLRSLRSFFSLSSRSTQNKSSEGGSNVYSTSDDKDRLAGGDSANRSWAQRDHAGYENLELGKVPNAAHGEIIVSRSFGQDISNVRSARGGR